MNLTNIFGPRFRKTSLVYFPFNFSFVIILLCFTTKIFSPDVPEKFVLKLIARNLPIIVPWALFFAHTLYSYFDTPQKKSVPKAKEDIELTPRAPNPPTPVFPDPVTGTLRPLSPDFVEIDLGEGPSNNGLPGPPRPFLTCEV